MAAISESKMSIVNSMAVRSREAEYFRDFMRPEWKTKSGDSGMNLWEQGGMYSLYKVPEGSIPEWFRLYEACRKAGIIMHWTQKQDKDKSGIRYDYDIWQTIGDRLITTDGARNLVKGNARQIAKIMKMEGASIYFVISLRSKITYNEEKKMWREGIKLDAAALHVSRDAKRFLIKNNIESKITSAALKSDKFHDIDLSLDTASCYVPLCLVGSCKADSTPYVPTWAFKVTFEDEHVDVEEDKSYITECKNLAYEMNVNWGLDRQLFVPQDGFVSAIKVLSKKSTEEQNIERKMLEEINQLSLNDPDCQHVKLLLEMLAPWRCDSYLEWRKIVYALVNSEDKYVSLAKWWSRKSSKYEEPAFEKCVAEARAKAGALTGLNINWLSNIAKHDSPERWNESVNLSSFKSLMRIVFDKIWRGQVGDFHFATILKPMIVNKFKTEIIGTTRTWYEFKFPGDKIEPGQAYKWVATSGPTTLYEYSYNKLHAICCQVVESLEEQISHCQEKSLIQFMDHLKKEFCKSAKKLATDGFQNAIMRQLERLLLEPGFSKKLDVHPFAIGVRQGILVLDEKGFKPKLVKAFNTFNVSHFTDTHYVDFDPQDPLQRKILTLMRSQFPDNETDLFEYIMGFRAAAIDNRSRETIIVLTVGPGSNGKTLISEMMKAALGSKYASDLPIGLFLAGRESNPEGPQSHTMRLKTLRYAYYEEGPAYANLDLPKVKRITGGGEMTNREMHGKSETFVTNCYHQMLSNHEFAIETHEEAIWRRIRYFRMPLKFKQTTGIDPYNPNDPTHRLADNTWSKSFIKTPECKSAMLAVLTFFHRKLMTKFGGNMDNIPHPTLDKQTMAYRHSQDSLARFLDTRIAKRASTDMYMGQLTSIDTIAEYYGEWYKLNIRDTKLFKHKIIVDIRESGIKSLFKEDKSGTYLNGDYRVLSAGEELKEGESLYQKISETRREAKYAFTFPAETIDQYLERVEREFAELEAMVPQEIDMSNSYIDEIYESGPLVARPVNEGETLEEIEGKARAKYAREEGMPTVNASVLD